MKHVLVTKAKLYIELHDINKLGCLQIDRAKKYLKLTYYRIQQGGGIKIIHIRAPHYG